MAALTPVQDEVVRQAALHLMTAKHGTKKAIIAEAAARTGLSEKTVYRHIRAVRPRTKMAPNGRITLLRKRRCDAGTTALALEEARLIGAYLVQTRRANGKYLADLAAAVDTLRANGLILAGRVDPETGEFHPLSLSAINRALKRYGCHPEQLRQPTPKVSLRSLHPNHCWQIDPSLCVLYYLRGQRGLRAMPRDEFYKNKPRNLARIENDRVWRYVFVDHATGAFYVEYVLGSESGANLCSTFIAAMQPRGSHDPFHGVPLMVMVDPGSANTGHMFKNLCAALGVAIWINQPGQPWAKGSVEKHNDIIECEFEHRLKFQRVESLQELNEAAWRWSRGFQARAVHTRHGKTRFSAWMQITPSQLRVAPTAEVCHSLAVSAPVERTVSPQLRVQWRGKHFDVSGVPGVIVGQKLQLARNAWADEDTAHVLSVDENGRPMHYVVPARARGDFGFFVDAVPLGEFRRHADTRVDAQRRAIERIAMDAATDEEAAAKRKAGALPFGGRIDPYLAGDTLPGVAHLPRAGTPLEVDAPNVVLATRRHEAPIKREFAPLNHVEAAVALKPLVERAGQAWTAAMYARTAERWPEGLPVDQVEAWAADLATPPRGGLRVVDGGAA